MMNPSDAVKIMYAKEIAASGDRVGHAGTLDPMATGVLPVFVGRATRAVEFASESEKEYIAGLKLGVYFNTRSLPRRTLYLSNRRSDSC